MTRVRRVVAAAVPILVGGVLLSAPAWSAPAEPNKPSASESADSGRLMGVVTDTAGAPLEETLISATGPAGVSLALCDADGRFEFRALLPGTYLLRAHVSGFSSTQRYLVEIRSGLATVHAVTLRRVQGEPATPKFLAAGFGEALGGATSLGFLAQPIDDGAVPGREDPVADGAETESVTPHDDSEKAWRLRRARRSVLKESEFNLLGGDSATPDSHGGFATPMAADRYGMHDAPGAFPVSGQLHLLTRAQVDSSADLWSTDILPGQVAHVSVGGPDQGSPWSLRGAVRTGDAGSWALAGGYLSEPTEDHAIAVGVSYSRQNLQTASTRLSLSPSGAPRQLVIDPGAPATSREVGSVSLDGTWVASPAVTVDYGANLARYGYLPEGGLLSPNAMLTIEPMGHTRVRVAVAQYMLAPGAEEFLPPSEGVWLPPERTFALLSPTDPLTAERSHHLELALERDFGETSTVGVRRFYQDVDDQMIALFGVRPQLPNVSSDHYYVTSASGVTSEGWGVMFSHTVAGRVRGAVDYSLTQAQWQPWVASGLSPQTIGVFRTGAERFHDVTTSVETEIPETATEVIVLYRMNTAFSVKDVDTHALRPGLDGRFALRVKQTLPFTPFDGSDWQVLVDVRNLFREQAIGASVYDELLVASPPKQVVGGLIVHF